MKTVNIHQAKTHLSRLVEDAAAGESFIIAKAGKPMVKVERVGADAQLPRSGFMRGQFTVPEDFNRMMEDEIAEMFYGKDDFSDFES